MTSYLIKPRDAIFIKGYGFLYFAKNVGKNINKNISKNVSGKYSQKYSLDHDKKSGTDALKTSSKRVIYKTAEATDDLIGNKIANRTTKVTTEHVKEIPKERYISPEEREETIDELRLK